MRVVTCESNGDDRLRDSKREECAILADLWPHPLRCAADVSLLLLVVGCAADRTGAGIETATRRESEVIECECMERVCAVVVDVRDSDRGRGRS